MELISPPVEYFPMQATCMYNYDIRYKIYQILILQFESNNLMNTLQYIYIPFTATTGSMFFAEPVLYTTVIRNGFVVDTSTFFPVCPADSM